MKKQSDVFSEIIVGAFMIGVLALLAYFTIVISGVDILCGKQRVNAKIAFDDIGGLKERDSVIYRGMKVGIVEDIELGGGGVTLTANITRDVVMRESYRITVASTSLLGGNYLLLEEGTGAELPLDGTTFQGIPPTDWMREIGDIAKNIREFTAEGGVKAVVTNLEAATESAKVVLRRVEDGEGSLGKLLSSDETVYNDIRDAIADLKATTASAKEIAARLEKGEGTLGKLMSKEDTVYDDLKKSLSNVTEISDRLARGEGTMGKLLSSDDSVYADLKSAMADVRASMADIRSATARMESGEGLLGRLSKDEEFANHATQLLANLEKVSDSLAKGDGTLGKLATDDAMYNELNGLMKDVRQIVDNYRDTTPISTFGSLIMGGL